MNRRPSGARLKSFRRTLDEAEGLLDEPPLRTELAQAEIERIAEFHYASVLAGDEEFTAEHAQSDEDLVRSVARQLAEAGIEYGMPPFDATSLSEMLEALNCAMNAYARSVGRQVNDFKASDVAYALNKMTGNENVPIIRSFLFPDREPSSPVSSKGVSKQLRKYVDTPVKQEKRILVLRAQSDPHDEVLRFQVEELEPKGQP